MNFDTIYIDEPNRAKEERYFIGKRERLATVTSVSFINKSRLVSAHLVGETMHLIECDPAQKKHHTLDVIETCYDHQPTITDLIDYDGDKTILTH
jgi:hypothetical protein